MTLDKKIEEARDEAKSAMAQAMSLDKKIEEARDEAKSAMAQAIVGSLEAAADTLATHPNLRAMFASDPVRGVRSIVETIRLRHVDGMSDEQLLAQSARILALATGAGPVQ